MQQETVIVLDFGGQYNQLIAAVSVNATFIAKFILTVLTWPKSRPKIRRALSLPVVPTALTCRIPLPSIPKYILGVFRYWASAMAAS